MKGTITYDNEKKFFKIVVPYDIIFPYLEKLHDIIPEKFSAFLENKYKRDGKNNFHITVLNYLEVEELGGIEQSAEKIKKICGDKIIDDIIFLGIGKAEKDGNESYYIVVRSKQINDLRQKLGLGKKDLHVSLAFYPRDIHGVPKDETTIIVKDREKNDFFVFVTDMDMTIANPFTRETDKKKQYEYHLCLQDEPIKAGTDFLKKIYQKFKKRNLELKFIILTGRNCSMKKNGEKIDLTKLYEKWWNQHLKGLPLFKIYCKQKKEIQEKSEILKRRKMKEILEQFNVVGILDDDEKCLENMKDLNVALFHINGNSIKKINKNK